MIEFFSEWQQQLYIPAIQQLLLVVVVIVGVHKRRQFSNLRYFSLYAAALIWVEISTAIYYEAFAENYNVDFWAGISNYSDYFFTLLELFVLCHFYYQVIQSSVYKRLIFYSNGLFVAFFGYMGITDNLFYKDISENTQSIVYTVQATLLIMISSLYFVEVIKGPSGRILKQEPGFWISVGVVVFMGGTLPYSLMENFIRSHFSEFGVKTYTIFPLFYIFLFLMVLRALLCRSVIGEHKIEAKKNFPQYQNSK